MKIHFLRHGMTTANEKRLYYGATDLPLSERGVEELKRFRKTLMLPTADVYITSGMQRAKESLRLLFGKIPQQTIEELNEYNFGDFEMKSYEELKNDPAYHRWTTGDENTPCPNGESQNQFVKRIIKGLEIIQKMEVENVVAVCHGGVIATLMTLLFPNQKHHYYEWVPECGRGFSVETAGGSYSYTTI